MLALINATANCAQAYHGKRAYIKVHASTGQRCSSIHDPRDGAPINFNFLPMLASKSMGVLPHTVQAYALDEPTDGLDVPGRRDVLGLVREQAEAGRAIVISSHIMSEVERVVDRVGVMRRGKLVAEGSLQEVKKVAGADNLDDAFVQLVE